MEEYLSLFIDKDYPYFIDKYLKTKTLTRLKNVTQFCGCDYTDLYCPLFMFTRYDHSLVVAHMTWHFTHDKKETIVALLHDVGTPTFAHCIDYVFGDYMEQESSEKPIIQVINQDQELLELLKSDDIFLNDLRDFSPYHILENKSPNLCADRLDGVLHTVYVWLHTHSLEEIKRVYENIVILENEEGYPELGFKNVVVAESFVEMVFNYSLELQGKKDKYVMKYVSEIVKASFEKGLLSLDDLYTKTEKELCESFADNFTSWKKFRDAKVISTSFERSDDRFSVSLKAKKRNVIPLVHLKNKSKRIDEISEKAKCKYSLIESYEEDGFAFIEGLEKI